MQNTLELCECNGTFNLHPKGADGCFLYGYQYNSLGYLDILLDENKRLTNENKFLTILNINLASKIQPGFFTKVKEWIRHKLAPWKMNY
jgi:hypothetical protein